MGVQHEPTTPSMRCGQDRGTPGHVPGVAGEVDHVAGGAGGDVHGAVYMSRPTVSERAADLLVLAR